MLILNKQNILGDTPYLLSVSSSIIAKVFIQIYYFIRKERQYIAVCVLRFLRGTNRRCVDT